MAKKKKPERAALLKAAKELNDDMGLDGTDKIKLGKLATADSLEEGIAKAAKLFESADQFGKETEEVIKALGIPLPNEGKEDKEPEETTAEATKAKPVAHKWKVGDRCLAPFDESDEKYPGAIKTIKGARAAVKFDDGDVGQCPLDDLEQEPALTSAGGWSVGDKACATHKGEVHRGEVIGFHNEGKNADLRIGKAERLVLPVSILRTPAEQDAAEDAAAKKKGKDKGKSRGKTPTGAEQEADKPKQKKGGVNRIVYDMIKEGATKAAITKAVTKAYAAKDVDEDYIMQRLCRYAAEATKFLIRDGEEDTINPFEKDKPKPKPKAETKAKKKAAGKKKSKSK